MKTIMFLFTILLSFNTFADSKIYHNDDETYYANCYTAGKYTNPAVVVVADKHEGSHKGGTITINGKEVVSQFFSNSTDRRWVTKQQIFVLTGKRTGNLYNTNKMNHSILSVRCSEI